MSKSQLSTQNNPSRPYALPLADAGAESSDSDGRGRLSTESLAVNLLAQAESTECALTLDKVQGRLCVSIFGLVSGHARISNDVDKGTIAVKKKRLAKSDDQVSNRYAPLWYAQEIVSSIALVETGNAKEAGLTIVGSAIAGRNRVAHEILATARADKLRFSSQATDDGHGSSARC
jgi:hypothetical protein